MKHYGDITKISGRDITIVDIVCGGSPCQDLSVAGKREGLAGERSGLFMEQIRLIKEMRESDRANGRATINIRPRYMVWENVPGAFSSNKGEDFREVLEETAKVAERDACIPGSPNGKWPHSGCIMGDGWSIAWRVHDAQFWGVPQRRKRIALVADFGGLTAPEILFERESMSGNITESGKAGQGVATDVGSGITETGGGNVPMVMESSNGDIAGTLYANEAYDKWSESEKSASLRASGGVYGGGSESLSVGSVVRRLTPLECERLQGYPDGWTNIGEWYDSKGKKHKGESDSPRYKALGNSIALPFWQWMAERMCKYIENPTMASLFDGIGGFPLVYSRCGCVPVWASEIEEFPIAVTRIRFPEGSECE